MLHTIKIYEVTFTNLKGTHTLHMKKEKDAKSFVEVCEEWMNASYIETTAEVKVTDQIKNEFQKLIKDIRENSFGITRGDYRGNCLYPKPMMTRVQMDKGQATIICGEGNSEETKVRAQKLMEIESFKAFLQRYEATAKIEYYRSKEAYQIKIQF